MRKYTAFLLTGDVDTSGEHMFEAQNSKTKEYADAVHNLVNGYFALGPCNWRQGWVCFVNDDRNDDPFLNYPMQILVEKLTAEAFCCLSSSVLVFKHPERHLELVDAIRTYMRLYKR